MITASALIAAVVAALPTDPDLIGDAPEMVVGYETVHTTEAEQADGVPASYSMPLLGDAELVARRVVRAVLLVLAEEMDATAPAYLAMLDEVPS